MGIPLSTGMQYKRHPDEMPHPNDPVRYDPLYGFPQGREEKVMIATEAEMHSAKIPLKDRDYCAHLLIAFRQCRREMFPWTSRCEHERHHYYQCQYAEHVDRMKDYERERRLMARDKRLGRTPPEIAVGAA